MYKLSLKDTVSHCHQVITQQGSAGPAGSPCCSLSREQGGMDDQNQQHGSLEVFGAAHAKTSSHKGSGSAPAGSSLAPSQELSPCLAPSPGNARQDGGDVPSPLGTAESCSGDA